MFFSKPAGYKLVDRGDFDSIDFQEGSFTIDSLWHNLDLSSIIPVNAKFVVLFWKSENSVADVTAYLAGEGITQYFNNFTIKSISNTNDSCHQFILRIGDNSVIQYQINNTGVWIITLNVVGWFV